jgi:hypothetical protein
MERALTDIGDPHFTRTKRVDGVARLERILDAKTRTLGVRLRGEGLPKKRVERNSTSPTHGFHCRNDRCASCRVQYGMQHSCFEIWARGLWSCEQRQAKASRQWSVREGSSFYFANQKHFIAFN